MSSNDKYQKVWNFAEPPQQIFLPCNAINSLYNTNNTFPFSALGSNVTDSAFNVGVAVPFIDDYPMIYSNTDTAEVLTGSNHTFQWVPPTGLIVLRMRVYFAFAYNVTAFSAGTFTLDSATFSFYEEDGAGNVVEFLIPERTKPSALSALTANGAEIFIYSDIYTDKFILSDNKNYAMALAVGVTPGTGTANVGLVLTVPNSFTTNTLKPFYPTGVMLTCLPDTNANREVYFRNQGDFK